MSCLISEISSMFCYKWLWFGSAERDHAKHFRGLYLYQHHHKYTHQPLPQEFCISLSYILPVLLSSITAYRARKKMSSTESGQLPMHVTDPPGGFAVKVMFVSVSNLLEEGLRNVIVSLRNTTLADSTAKYKEILPDGRESVAVHLAVTIASSCILISDPDPFKTKLPLSQSKYFGCAVLRKTKCQ